MRAHWNLKERVLISFMQAFGKSLRLISEHEINRSREIGFVEVLGGELREKDKLLGRLRFQENFPVCVLANIDVRPIIESRSPHRFFVSRKTQRMNQVQSRPRARAKTRDGSRVLRDEGLMEN